MSRRRAFVVVLDGCGAGATDDAADYADAGTNTLAHVAEAAGGLDLPVLGRLGLGSILPLAGVPPAEAPAIHGRLHPLGAGKDSASGHAELVGAVARRPPPTWPAGLPAEVLARVATVTGRRVLGGAPSDGLAAIAEHGEAARREAALIAYTSQDSVLQLAAHEDAVPRAELHAACRAVREVMTGEHAVGRVIARPFDGPPGAFRRTDGRLDLALPPPGRTHLDALVEAGVAVHAVGKVCQLLAGRGCTHEHPAPTNAQALAALDRLVEEADDGLVFANLVETDQVYGHRGDAEGFHRALQEIDAAAGRWLERLGERDLLVLTADHGVDPRHPGTDHTREHVPLLATAPGLPGRRHDGPMADVGATVHRWLTGRDAPGVPGTAFAG